MTEGCSDSDGDEDTSSPVGVALRVGGADGADEGEGDDDDFAGVTVRLSNSKIPSSSTCSGTGSTAVAIHSSSAMRSSESM